MKTNLKLNILIIVLFSILWMTIIVLYLRKRDKKNQANHKLHKPNKE